MHMQKRAELFVWATFILIFLSFWVLDFTTIMFSVCVCACVRAAGFYKCKLRQKFYDVALYQHTWVISSVCYVELCYSSTVTVVILCVEGEETLYQRLSQMFSDTNGIMRFGNHGFHPSLWEEVMFPVITDLSAHSAHTDPPPPPASLTPSAVSPPAWPFLSPNFCPPLAPHPVFFT